MAGVFAGPVYSALRRASLIYPQPVAIACGRILRARSHTERLDACVRAGEVLTRYVAAVALASFAAREGGDALDISILEGVLVLRALSYPRRSRYRTLRCPILQRPILPRVSSRRGDSETGVSRIQPWNHF